jgi:hypothetical protein
MLESQTLKDKAPAVASATVVMPSLLDRIRIDLADKYYQQNFTNDGQRFLAWYLRNCYCRTPIQARDDITDGPNDKEIDAVIIDEEKRQSGGHAFAGKGRATERMAVQEMKPRRPARWSRSTGRLCS